MDGWSFDERQAASGDFSLGAAQRHDPYYDALHWGYPAQVAWQSCRTAPNFFPTRPRRHMMSLTESEALTHVLDARQRTSRHTVDVHAALLGAVHGWKTCTTEQVAAITGRPDLRSGLATPYATTLAAGLVDLGLLQTGTHGPRLLRAADPWSAHADLMKGLSLRQLLEVTGGGPWTSGPDTPRHNVLSTELALRLSEYLDIGTVLTEEYSRLHELAGPRWHQDGWAINPRAAADLTVVRADGLRIAMELTASAGRSLEMKINSYARLFSNEAPGLVVVFVVAAPVAPGAPCPQNLRARVMRLIEGAVRRHPGTSLNRSAHRFGVIAWDEWFPGPRLVSDRFFSLTALSPPDIAGPLFWAPTAFLDSHAVPMDLAGDGLSTQRADGWLRLVELAKLRGSTPHWLRGPLRPEALKELNGWVLAASRPAYGLDELR